MLVRMQGMQKGCVYTLIAGACGSSVECDDGERGKRSAS